MRRPFAERISRVSLIEIRTRSLVVTSLIGRQPASVSSMSSCSSYICLQGDSWTVTLVQLASVGAANRRFADDLQSLPLRVFLPVPFISLEPFWETATSWNKRTHWWRVRKVKESSWISISFKGFNICPEIKKFIVLIWGFFETVLTLWKMICKLIFENIFEKHYFDLSQSDIYIRLIYWWNIWKVWNFLQLNK